MLPSHDIIFFLFFFSNKFYCIHIYILAISIWISIWFGGIIYLVLWFKTHIPHESQYISIPFNVGPDNDPYVGDSIFQMNWVSAVAADALASGFSRLTTAVEYWTCMTGELLFFYIDSNYQGWINAKESYKMERHNYFLIEKNVARKGLIYFLFNSIPRVSKSASVGIDSCQSSQ